MLQQFSFVHLYIPHDTYVQEGLSRIARQAHWITEWPFLAAAFKHGWLAGGGGLDAQTDTIYAPRIFFYSRQY